MQVCVSRRVLWRKAWGQTERQKNSFQQMGCTLRAYSCFCPPLLTGRHDTGTKRARRTSWPCTSSSWRSAPSRSPPGSAHFRRPSLPFHANAADQMPRPRRVASGRRRRSCRRGLAGRGGGGSPDGARGMRLDWKRGLWPGAVRPQAESRCWGQGSRRVQPAPAAPPGVNPSELGHRRSCREEAKRLKLRRVKASFH